MPIFSLTKQALEDLREIGRYTQQGWGRDQRRHYLVLPVIVRCHRPSPCFRTVRLT